MVQEFLYEERCLNALELIEAPQCSSDIKSRVLCAAIWARQHSIISRIIEFGADVNAPVSNCIPLCIAISSQDLDASRLLLQSGADPNIPCPAFGSAMYAACFREDFPLDFATSVLSLLLKHGADFHTPNDNCGSALIALAKASTERALALWQFLIDLAIPCDPPNEAETTPMIAAVSSEGSESLSLIQLLQGSGADVNREGQYLGMISSPLVAALRSDTELTLEKVQFLVRHGARLNDFALGYSNSLQMFLDSDAVDSFVVEYLVNAGADVNAPPAMNDQGTASEIAIRQYRECNNDHKEMWMNIILLLYRHDATFTAPDFEFLFEEPRFQVLAEGAMGWD